MDASNLIKPVLANGEIRCIGSTPTRNTAASSRKITHLHVASRKSMCRSRARGDHRFCKGLKSRFEEHHGVSTTMRRSSRRRSWLPHINDRRLPDKAIDVIDEAGANLRLKPAASAERVTVEMVENIVAKMARIPAKSVSASDRDLAANARAGPQA